MAKAETELSLEEVVRILEGLPKDSKGKPLSANDKPARSYDKAVEYLPAMQAALTELEQLRAAAPVALEPDATIAPYTLEPGMFNAMVAMSVAQEAALAEREVAVAEREAAVEAREREAAAREDVAEAREAKAIEARKQYEEQQKMVEIQIASLKEGTVAEAFKGKKGQKAPVPAVEAQEAVAVVDSPSFERPPGYGEPAGWICRIEAEGFTWTYRLAAKYKKHKKLTWTRRRVVGKKQFNETVKGYTIENPPPEVLDYILNGGVGRKAGWLYHASEGKKT